MALEETTAKLDTGRTHRMIRVTDLVPAMAAALSGAVRVGDVLVAIDGQGTDTMDMEGVRERVVGPRGSCVVFKFVRGADGVPVLDESAGVEFSILLKRGAWGPEHAVACLAACYHRACLPACSSKIHLHASAQAHRQLRLVLRMLACMRWGVRKACVAKSCRMHMVRISQARTMIARTSEKQLHKQRRWSHRRTGTWRTCTAGRSQAPCPHRRLSAALCSPLQRRVRRALKTHRCRPPRLTSAWWSRACDRYARIASSTDVDEPWLIILKRGREATNPRTQRLATAKKHTHVSGGSGRASALCQGRRLCSVYIFSRAIHTHTHTQASEATRQALFSRAMHALGSSAAPCNPCL